MDCLWVALAICWVDGSLSWGRGHRPTGFHGLGALQSAAPDKTGASGQNAQGDGLLVPGRGRGPSVCAGRGVLEGERLKGETPVKCVVVAHAAPEPESPEPESPSVVCSCVISIWAPRWVPGTRSRTRGTARRPVSAGCHRDFLEKRVGCVRCWCSVRPSPQTPPLRAGRTSVSLTSGLRRPLGWSVGPNSTSRVNCSTWPFS